jgi:hypothetical protein
MFYHMREYVEIKKLPAFAEAMATNPGSRLLTGDRPPENFRAIAVPVGDVPSALGWRRSKASGRGRLNPLQLPSQAAVE